MWHACTKDQPVLHRLLSLLALDKQKSINFLCFGCLFVRSKYSKAYLCQMI